MFPPPLSLSLSLSPGYADRIQWNDLQNARRFRRFATILTITGLILGCALAVCVPFIIIPLVIANNENEGM